jgi:hypothetical protein
MYPEAKRSIDEASQKCFFRKISESHNAILFLLDVAGNIDSYSTIRFFKDLGVQIGNNIHTISVAMIYLYTSLIATSLVG